jgi:hypothetical protein
MTNHPPTGYPSSLRLLNKFKTSYPLDKFVTHAFPVDQVDKAMAQAFDIDSCMKVVRTSGSARGVDRFQPIAVIPEATAHTP